MTGQDQIIAAINDARVAKSQLRIRGHDSKQHLFPLRAETVDLPTEDLSGVLQYDPAELVVTVAAGTPIEQVMALLAQQDQCFAFEPPCFGARGTIGGMVSAGYSGPSRPWSGAVRDAVLGVEMVNGLGEHLRFGGQVMKNVAGYDVSRLMVGALGALGVLLSVSIRVHPAPECVVTQVFEMTAARANELCRSLAQRYLPVNATLWHDNKLYVRLSGHQETVLQSARELGGERLNVATFWVDQTNHNRHFFSLSGQDAHRRGKKLWRIVTPPAAQLPAMPPLDMLVEWAGGLRWLWHADDDFVYRYATEQRGWAWPIAHSLGLDSVQQKTMRALKRAFDPDNLFLSPLPLGLNHAD